MMKRNQTIPVSVGNIVLGHSEKIKIQSMATIKTSKIEEVSNQINQLALYGADLMRVSILDEEDAKALYEIKKRISIPLVADIHFYPHLALKALENGADKIRINPGNLPLDSLKEIIRCAKKNHAAIRIGVNSGSISESILEKHQNKVTADGMIELLRQYLLPFQEEKFDSIVLSLKSSSPLLSMEVYRLASENFPYPLHLGITEAGGKDIGLIRSAVGLTPLLLEGIGDTIRISLTADPLEEIFAAKHLLHDLNLYPNMPTLISCPTCGRTEVNVLEIVNRLTPELEKIHAPIKVAVMGCIVNGPGEAKHADIGLAGGKNKFLLFSKGKPLRTVKEEEAYIVLLEEIKKFIALK